jgi:hypothetical protein
MFRDICRLYDAVELLLEATTQCEAICQQGEESGQVETCTDAVQHTKLAVQSLHLFRGTLLLEPLLAVSLACWVGTRVSFGLQTPETCKSLK